MAPGGGGGVSVLLSSLALIALLTVSYSLYAYPNGTGTQHAQPTASRGKSDYAIANEEVALSRAGDADATVALAHEMFRNAGIPTQIADSFGYTRRVVQAQTEYQKGTLPPIHEKDIVTAVNNLANSLGLPAWAHTTQPEVRKLRVRLFLAIPQLFVSHAPPDAQGHHQLLSPDMSPLEAGYIATTMLYMKTFSSDFQFSDKERAQYQSQVRGALVAEQQRRETLMLNIIQGRSSSVSVADLLPAADHLFDDLGIRKQTTSAKNSTPEASAATAKGAL